MTYAKYYIVLLFALLFGFQNQAQEFQQKANTIETIMESISEELEGDADYSLILDDLEELAENPLNINAATKDDFRKLHMLNEAQILNLIEHRQKFGRILTIYELKTIDGFDRSILEKISPFVLFGELPDTETKMHAVARHQLFLRAIQNWPTSEDYQKTDNEAPRFEGSPTKIYTRYRLEYGDFSSGITAEKDPGEAFFTGSNNTGFDYYSGYLNFRFNSFLKNIVIGDYAVKAGQGLVIWQGFPTRKSYDVINTSKINAGIKPYSSTNENKFFRGSSATFGIKNMDLTVFYSRKNMDANIVYSNIDSSSTHFTSQQTSGYHRTASEIEDEKSITEINKGIILNFRKNRIKIGATVLHQKFGLPYMRSKSPSNQFKFEGTENLNIGINYQYFVNKYQFFGEAAISKSTGKAFIQGLIAHIHDRAALSLLYRNFDRNYHSLWGNPFSENSGTINENGIYVGLSLLPVQHFKLSAYADYYHSPWINFTTMAPAGGNDYLVQLDYTPSKKIQCYIRYKTENKETKTKLDYKYINETVNTKHLRFQIQYTLSEIHSFRTRVEYSGFNRTENGKIIFQDFIYNPAKIPFSANFRFALFDTDGYNTRIYAYENDLLYNYSIPAYYGKGFKTYINIKYKIFNNFVTSLKIANTSFTANNTTSTTPSTASKKTLTEVKFQIRLKF